METCPNCAAKIVDSVFSKNFLFPQDDVKTMNEICSTDFVALCEKCGIEVMNNSIIIAGEMREKLKIEMQLLLENVPLCSIHNPPGWGFKLVDLVTAQSVTGTGLFSDVTSAFTDLFGAQSGAYNAKIRAGEDLCRASLRAQALSAGAHAIVGVDVDYAEVGGQRAMLMVCMTGTAIAIEDVHIVAPELKQAVERYSDCRARYTMLLDVNKFRSYP